MARSSLPWSDCIAISPETAGALLNLSRRAVITAIKEGEIVGKQIRGRWCVDVAALKVLLSSGPKASAEPNVSALRGKVQRRRGRPPKQAAEVIEFPSTWLRSAF